MNDVLATSLKKVGSKTKDLVFAWTLQIVD